MRICLDLTIDQEEDAKMEPLSSCSYRKMRTAGDRPMSAESFPGRFSSRIWKKKSIGSGAARLIRSGENELGREIPIIAMTANAFQEDAEKCIAVGMNAHLAKPLDIEKVKMTIYKYI